VLRIVLFTDFSAFSRPVVSPPISTVKKYDTKVTFYIELKKMIGTASGDFLDLKAYEPDMRQMIDNYITASDANKIGDFEDLTLLDFVGRQGETLTGNEGSNQKEGAAEAIENNIRRKVIEKVTVNPRYYARMSEILDKLIEQRKQGVLDYAQMLELYIKLAKDVDRPEANQEYPEKIRKSKALMAIYDNTGEDEELALKIHKAVLDNKMADFRENKVIVKRIKKALFQILGDDAKVEEVYKIIEKQEEY
jgi:type I restriction enzyme R subunit